MKVRHFCRLVGYVVRGHGGSVTPSTFPTQENCDSILAADNLFFSKHDRILFFRCILPSLSLLVTVQCTCSRSVAPY